MMPSAPGYVRDYKQERKQAKKRGETGVGSKSGDATRHRARRKYINRHGALSSDTHVDHKNTIKNGGGNALSNLTSRSKSSNTSAGGKAGDRKGKAAGGKKGGSK
jgi:5-methylcytosine-specific restriction endonuclease McrA